jgi:putative DNA primase/helicase
MRRVRMLWRDRIPAGRVGIVYGPPGQGKSTLLATIAAEVSRAGGRVLIASAEDDPEGTLRPRMAAAGADLDRVVLLSTKVADGETNLVLPRDLPALRRWMSATALLIIDPFVAHLGDEVNSWREQDVRAKVFAPLHAYANTAGCTVALVMHLNKSDRGDPLSRISGTGGFGGAARYALLLGSHPDDLGLDEPERRLALVHVKASEGRKRPAMVYRRRERYLALEDDEVADVPVLELVDDEARISPESVLEHTDPDEAGAFTEALEFLRGELGEGPKLAKRLLATTRERGDFSERTLRKAKRALGVESDKDAEGWWWVWSPNSKGRR